MGIVTSDDLCEIKRRKERKTMGREGRRDRYMMIRCAVRETQNALTEPMARKKENVAALVSMYWDNVARNPLGPAPPLQNKNKKRH